MSWLYLFGAIILEVISSMGLKYSEGFTKIYPAILSLLGYGFCFFLLSKALQNIDISLAYAVWAGLGILLVSSIGIIVFKEDINFVKILGIFLILVGVIVLNLVSKH